MVSYFTVAIVCAWILGVFYFLAGFMVLIGFRISRPAIETRIYYAIQYLFAASFFGMGLHYLHLGYFGAIHGILPSQENLISTVANVSQVATLPAVLFIALYMRFKTGPLE
jgi:hypothetical protein